MAESVLYPLADVYKILENIAMHSRIMQHHAGCQDHAALFFSPYGFRPTLHIEAPVNLEFRTGNVVAIAGTQIDASTGDFIDRAEPPHRDLL